MILFYGIFKLSYSTFQIMTTTKPQIKYQVLFIGDSVSNPRVIGEYVSRTRASNKANKLDLDYGAYRHSVKRVELQSYGEYR